MQIGSGASHLLQLFKPVVKGLADTLGRNYEVLLHDISQPNSSVIAIENGHLTGREVGAPPTDFLLELVQSKQDSDENLVLNYKNKTPDGKQIKSSTILIRDHEQNIIGALCINFDLTEVEVARNLLEELAYTEEEQTKEKFPGTVNEFLELMFEKAVSRVNKPVSLLDKEEKIKVVKYLEENDVFDIKRSVKLVANKLQVSKYTIYNYLEEARIES